MDRFLALLGVMAGFFALAFTLRSSLGLRSREPLANDDVLAYAAELNWVVGSKDDCDWANPGKNSYEHW